MSLHGRVERTMLVAAALGSISPAWADIVYGDTGGYYQSPVVANTGSGDRAVP